MNKNSILRSLLAATLVIVGVLIFFLTIDTTASRRAAEDKRVTEKKNRDIGPDPTPSLEPQGRPRAPQPTAPTTAATEKKSIGIAGRVIGPGDMSVSGASVTLSVDRSVVEPWSQEGAAEQTSTSDENGRFAMKPLQDAERYVLRVDHSDFASRLLSGIMVLEAGTRELEIRLERGGALVGRVIDEEGQALDDVDIVVYELTPHGKSPERDLFNVTLSSPEGEYRFDHLYPGLKRVTASKAGYATETQDVANVVTGSETELADFVLGRGAGIVGRTIDVLDGSPLEGVRIIARPVGQDNRRIVVGNYPPIESDADGQFRYEGLAPGAYRLSFHLSGYGKVESFHSADTGDEEVVAELKPLPSVRGFVVEATTGKPVEAFTLVLSVNEHLPLESGRSSQIFSGQQGTFEYVDPYLRGDFYIFALAEGYPPSRSDPINLEDGEDADDIVIQMQPSIRIRGRVSDSSGSGIADARVRLSPRLLDDSTETADLFMRVISQSVRNEEKSTLSDAAGFYEFDNLADGRYAVLAEHPDFAPSGTEETVVIPENGEVVLPDVTLSDGAVLKGVVVSGKGEPMADARVQIFRQGAGPGSGFYSATTHQDGHFEFVHLNPGRYGLQVKETSDRGNGGHNGFHLIERALSRQTRDVEFTLADGDLLELEVVQ